MNEKNLTVDDLAENETDAITAYSKGLMGAIPVFGGLFAEVVGQIIPNQRIDRVTEFMKILDGKFQELELDMEDVKSRMKREEYINLFEDGMWQAAKASSRERKEYIASLLSKSLTDEALNEIQQGVLLTLLNELNDIEVLILYSYSMIARSNQEFQQEHQEKLIGPVAFLGSGTETINQSAIHKTYKEKLLRLGMLEREFVKPKRGELPEFDEKTGMMKERSVSLSSLGRIFLRYIGYLGDKDY